MEPIENQGLRRGHHPQDPRRQFDEIVSQTASWEDLQCLDERQKVHKALNNAQPKINFRLICCTKPQRLLTPTSRKLPDHLRRVCYVEPDENPQTNKPQVQLKPSKRSKRLKQICSIQ